MSLAERFQKSATQGRNFTKMPKEPQRTDAYALYKQSTVGDCNTDKPAEADAAQRWGAWNSKKGMSKDAAMEKYIALIAELAPTCT